MSSRDDRPVHRSMEPAGSAHAFVRCDGCGELTGFNPADLLGTLGGDVPLCAACRAVRGR